jgi:hypothetical protein
MFAQGEGAVATRYSSVRNIEIQWPLLSNWAPAATSERNPTYGYRWTHNLYRPDCFAWGDIFSPNQKAYHTMYQAPYNVRGPSADFLSVSADQSCPAQLAEWWKQSPTRDDALAADACVPYKDQISGVNDLWSVVVDLANPTVGMVQAAGCAGSIPGALLEYLLSSAGREAA